MNYLVKGFLTRLDVLRTEILVCQGSDIYIYSRNWKCILEALRLQVGSNIPLYSSLLFFPSC